MSSRPICRLGGQEVASAILHDEHPRLRTSARAVPSGGASPSTRRGQRGRLRVGIDMVQVSEVQECLERFGDRYSRRVFTDHEIECCRGEPHTQAAGFAARFAAKEAMLKVLRPVEHNPEWRSIEVRRHPNGWCDMHLHARAAALADEAGITEVAMSLSHEGDLAIAIVAALGSGPDHCDRSE